MCLLGERVLVFCYLEFGFMVWLVWIMRFDCVLGFGLGDYLYYGFVGLC